MSRIFLFILLVLCPGLNNSVERSGMETCPRLNDFVVHSGIESCQVLCISTSFRVLHATKNWLNYFSHFQPFLLILNLFHLFHT